MDLFGHSPIMRANLVHQVKDDIKFLTTAGGVHGRLAMENGQKTSDVVGADATGGSAATTPPPPNYLPYIIGAAVLVGVWYYTRD